MTIMRPFTAAHEEYDNGLFCPAEDGPNELGLDAPLVARRLIREGLVDVFALESDVHVGVGLPWYTRRGNRRPLCVPDAFVAFGVRLRERRSWRIDREN